MSDYDISLSDIGACLLIFPLPLSCLLCIVRTSSSILEPLDPVSVDCLCLCTLNLLQDAMKAIIAQAALLTSLLSSLAESLSFIRSCRVESSINELVYNGNQLVPREDLGDLSLRTTNIPPYLDLANGTIIEARLCDCHIRSRYHSQRKSVLSSFIIPLCRTGQSTRLVPLLC